MNVYEIIVQYTKMLKNLDAWIDKATKHAEAKKFDPNVFVESRLAPDQFPLAKQVQSACDAAKFAAAYLAGKQAPSHPDTEKTIAELKKRIATCVAYVESIPKSDYEGWETRKVAPAWLHGKWLTGEDYLLQLSVPNFYFHVTTAYAILRHNGVDLGKMDYIASIPIKD